MARRRSGVRRAGGRIHAGAVLAVLLGLAAVGLVVTRAGGGAGTDAVMNAGDDAAGAADRYVTVPTRSGQDLLSRVAAMWDAAGRVQELERENRALRERDALNARLAERNARYEALLGMPADRFSREAVMEQAISAQLVLDSGGPFRRTLVANAGADHGVRVGYIALNENGLVGRVVSVGRRSARVLMLDDYSSRIPVMGEASRVRAVLAGQATRRPELLTQPYQVQAPRLDFIVGARSLREGERVITSGDGGLFPRGIPVGIATRGADEQWRVSLSAAQRPIDFVRLAPFVGVDTPERTPADPALEQFPLATASSASEIGREVMPPPPGAPSPAPTQLRPRTGAAAPAPAPARPAPSPAPALAEEPAPASPQPAEPPQ